MNPTAAEGLKLDRASFLILGFTAVLSPLYHTIVDTELSLDGRLSNSQPMTLSPSSYHSTKRTSSSLARSLYFLGERCKESHVLFTHDFFFFWVSRHSVCIVFLQMWEHYQFLHGNFHIRRFSLLHEFPPLSHLYFVLPHFLFLDQVQPLSWRFGRCPYNFQLHLIELAYQTFLFGEKSG